MKKPKKRGCGCMKHGRGCSPKLVASMCHAGRSRGGYHPSAVERTRGHRLERALLRDDDLAEAC